MAILTIIDILMRDDQKKNMNAEGTLSTRELEWSKNERTVYTVQS